jgi:hypothetical protein
VRGEKFLLIKDSVAKTHCYDLAAGHLPASQARRRKLFAGYQKEVALKLRSNQPRVVQINLSVFGFSRGAAQARAFVNWFMDLCERRGDKYYWAGIELNLSFLGIFDTVASVGLANLFDGGELAGHASWADNTMEIHPAVRRCSHFVAGHEVRACFPLDSVRVKDKYPSNAVEVMYPGVHSDVGGGYAPGDLGMWPRPSDNLSIMPGRNMYDAARQAGVPFPLFDDLKKTDRVLHASLVPSNELTTAYNNYLAACALTPGPVEQMHRQHMALYNSYRYKWRNVFTQRKMAYLQATKQEEKKDLWDVQNRFIYSMGFGLVDLYKSNELPASAAQRLEAMNKASGLQPTIKERRMAEIAKSINPQRVTPAIEGFFDLYVHDSMAGFKTKLDEYASNKIGVAKFRSIFKGNDQVEDIPAVGPIIKGVIKVYYAGTSVVVETWHDGTLYAKKAYAVGEKITVDAYHAGEKYTIEKYQQGKEVVIETVDAGEKFLISSYHTAKDAVIKVYYTGKNIVVETWHDGKLYAKKVYAVGEKITVDAYHAGKKCALEKYQQGKEVVIETVDAGEKLVIYSYHAAKDAVVQTAQEASDLATKAFDAVSEKIQDVWSNVMDTKHD